MENSALVDPTEQYRLGMSEVQITRMGFGGAPIGGFRGSVSEPEAQAALESALGAGLNFFDTSPFYGYGRSELRIGQALRDLPRDSFVLSTKVGRILEPYDVAHPPPGMRSGGLPFAARYDYSAAGAERSLEQSIMRLGIPEIDIVLIHDVDIFMHGNQQEADRRFDEAMSGAYPYLRKLRDAGTIKAVGVGLNEWEMSLRFAREADIDCILLAGRYTLLDQGALTELLPVCKEKGISVILGGPFNSGVLATGLTGAARYNYDAVPADVEQCVRAILRVCTHHGVELRAAALQFPLAHPAVASVVPGAVSADEVNDNVSSMRQPIPAQFWRDLADDGLVMAKAPTPAHPAAAMNDR